MVICLSYLQNLRQWQCCAGACIPRCRYTSELYLFLALAHQAPVLPPPPAAMDLLSGASTALAQLDIQQALGSVADLVAFDDSPILEQQPPQLQELRQ